MLRLENTDISGTVRECGRSCRCRSTARIPVGGEGPKNAELIFVGRNPGRTEDRRNRPFVGRSGVELTRFCRALGFERSEVGVLNLVKCYTKNDREPTDEEISGCRDHLRRELRFFDGKKVIFLMGRTTAGELMGLSGGIVRSSGKIFRSSTSSVVCVPMTHPSYWLRNRSSYLGVFNRIVPRLQTSLSELLGRELTSLDDVASGGVVES